MTTEERFEKLERELAAANRRNRRLMIGASVLLTVLACASDRLCAAPAAEVEISSGVWITVPEGWTEVPKAVLDEQAKALGVAKVCDKAFTMSGPQDWFAGPYIATNINLTARFNENDLKSFGSLNDVAQKAGRKLADMYPDLLKELEIGKRYYDSESRILWVTVTSGTGPGKTKSLVGIVLLKQGVVSITCVSDESSFAKHLALFQKTVRGVRVSESLKYPVKMPEAAKREVEISAGIWLTVPAGWVEIPKDVLTDYAAKLKMTGTYDCAFQQDNGNAWFTPPYLMVTVSRSGPMQERDLKLLAFATGHGADAALKKVQDEHPGMVANTALNKVYYDPQDQIIWATVSADVTGLGAIKGLSGTKLTSEGYATIACYSRESEFARHTDLFQETVKSVRLRGGLAYRAAASVQQTAAPAEDRSWRPGGIALTLAAMTLLVVGRWSFQRLRRREVKPARDGGSGTKESAEGGQAQAREQPEREDAAKKLSEPPAEDEGRTEQSPAAAGAFPNNKQTIILWVAMVLMVLAILFPPTWDGYEGWLFGPNSNSRDFAWPIVVAECLIVAILAGVGVVVARSKKQ